MDKGGLHGRGRTQANEQMGDSSKWTREYLRQIDKDIS